MDRRDVALIAAFTGAVLYRRKARGETDPRALAVAVAVIDGPKSVKRIRVTLDVPQATCSEWIAHAIVDGLVREIGTVDQRMHRFEITPTGLRALLRVRAIATQEHQDDDDDRDDNATDDDDD